MHKPPPEWLESLLGGLGLSQHSSFEWIGLLAGIAALILAVPALMPIYLTYIRERKDIKAEWPEAFDLLYKMYDGDDVKRLGAIKNELKKLATVATGAELRNAHFDFMQTVRMRIEHDLCAGFDPDTNSIGGIWSEQAGKLFWTEPAANRSLLSVKNCYALHDDAFLEGVTVYFDWLMEKQRSPEFVTSLKIKSGFVAPLQLLTGLLHYCDEDWAPIIGKFGEDTELDGDLVRERGYPFLRKLQAFIYDCWLLWGPSIPICGNACSQWNRGELSALQFGFGDENNSVVLVDKKDALSKYGEQFKSRSTLAYRASAIGRLRRATDVKQISDGRYARALTEVMEMDARRLMLDLSDGGGVTQLEGSYQTGGTPYYSAYLWVIVVIVREGDRPTFEPRLDGEKLMGKWTSLIPFFEHGNIADPETYDFLRRQLAEKAVAALSHVRKELNSVNSPLRFAYACAIDDSGCGHGLAYPMNRSGVSIKEHMVEAIRRLSDLQDGIGDELLDFSLYSGSNPFSSCKLPGILIPYYESLKRDLAH